MKKQKLFYTTLAFMLIVALSLLTSCARDLDVLEPAAYPNDAEVFIDGFSAGLQYAAFANTDVTAFDVDTEVMYSGIASMRFDVPSNGAPAGSFAGGAYFTEVGRDLTGYDALTFWAKASEAASIAVVGFGNDLDSLKYAASINGLNVNPYWQKFIIPIPDPSKLTKERGMFQYFAIPNEDGKGYSFWIDEVKFEKLGTVAHQKPAILAEQDQIIDAAIGDQLMIGGTTTTFNMPNGIDQELGIAPAYFKFHLTDSTIVSVNEIGVVTVLDSGDVVITASIDGINAKGSMTVKAVGALPRPTAPAPTPTVPADSVISMFSNAYTDVPVDTWNPFWEFSTTLNQDLLIDGNDVKLYTKLNFVGIEFLTAPINASEMTHFNIDIWTPDPTDPPAAFNILLVDLGPDGTIGGEDNSSHEVSITSPTLKTDEWVTISIPLSDFVGLSSRAQLGQLVLSGDPNTVYVDNVYFSNDGSGGGGGGTTTPTEAAPTPTADAANVISIFSDAYANLEGTDYPDWGQNTVVSNISVAGDNTLKFAGLNFQGIQLASSQDVSGMENLHIDFWTENSTALSVFLISNGPVETSYSLTVPTTGWASVDIPLSAFSPVDLADVIQFKFDGDGDIYLDNIYFYKSGGGGSGTEPTSPAPTPSQSESDVISLFSDAYTDITVDTWRTEWSSAEFEDVTIAGNAAKKYSALDFVGITTEASTIDASGMSHVHMDIWSSDFTSFSVKLVDFGADGGFDGGDDVEHQIDISTPNQGEWVSLDIPLSDFTNLTTRGHLAQYILVGQPTGATTVYLDNFYFYNDAGGGGGTEPTSAAPTPTQSESDVISFFSDAYTDITVDTWRTEWSSAVLEDVTIAGNAAKKYSALDFVGIVTEASTVDASGMTHVHIDVWSADFTFFGIKLVDFGANGVYDGGGDDVEHQFDITTPNQGEWVSLDIPLSDFTNLTTREHLAQYILVGQPTGATTVYIDNFFFYK